MDERGRAQDPRAHAAATSQTALDLILSAARFTRTVGRVSGVSYSSVAWRVLADLALQGPTRVSDLAAQQRVAQPTMTALVNRLAGEAWVDRQPDPEDGRATLVFVTTAGKAALESYRLAMAERIAPLLAGLSERDRQALDRAAGIMLELSEQV